MKRFTAILLLALTAALLFAGGGKEGAGSNKLQVLLSEEPTTGDGFVSTLQKWAADTGRELDMIVIPYDDQLTKFPLMSKNKDVPDLIATTRLSRRYPEEFITLEDIVDLDLFEEQALKTIGLDYDTGNIICLPYQFTITNVFYNKTAFDKVGLVAPTVDDPWTFDEVYEAAKLLVSSGAVKFGIAMDNSRARYDNLPYSFGGGILLKDGDTFKVAVNSPENIAALEMFVEWNNTVMPKAVWAGGTTDNPADYFKNGDVGIYFSGSWNYNTFVRQIDDFEWGVMTSPVGPGGGSAILGGTGLAIPKNANNLELAKEFIKWFYEDPENFSYFLNQDKGLSSLKAVTYTPEDEKIAADYKILQAEVAKVTDAFNIDESTDWKNYDPEYRDTLHQVVNGDFSASKGLNDYAKYLASKMGWEMAY